MIFIMLVSLYTVRAVLDLLGVEDYGIYNVVGSIVGMFTFLNGTLSTSCQRYFSVAIAKKDIKELNKYFCLNITIFSVFIVILLIIAETVGLWFLNNKLTIPYDRLFAANVVYQSSIIACAVSIFRVPYTALVISFEKMGAFAYIGIYEALFKLLIVYVLTLITWDKLIIYGILVFISSVSVSFIYYYYSRVKFHDVRFNIRFDKEEFKDIFSFSGWHFVGTISNVVREQCINILLNVFFNPTINAARAIAYQVNGVIAQFSDSFTTAVKPQIYKSFSAGELGNLYGLINQSTTVAAFLTSLLAIPFISNSQFVLSLWLKEVPEYTVSFTIIVLIIGIIESTNTSAIVPALATGKIKKFELITGSLAIANFPASYFALKLGAPAISTMIIATCIALVTVIWRAFLLKGLIGLPYKMYLVTLFRIGVAIILSGIGSFLLTKNKTPDFLHFGLYCIVSISLLCIFFYFIVLNTNEKKLIYKVVCRVMKNIKV